MASTPSKRLKTGTANPEGSHSDSESRETTETTESATSDEVIPVQPSPPSYLLHSVSLGQSSSTEHSTLVSGSSNQLPENLSQWRRKNIEDLNIRIVFEPETSPYELLTEKSWNGRRKGMGFPIRFSVIEAEEKQKKEMEEDLKIKKLIEYVKNSGFLKFIEEISCSSFEEFDLTTLKKLKSFAKETFIPNFLPGEFHAWFARFDKEVKNFIKILSRLVENVIRQIPNHEYLFQHLFDAFVKMFGLHSGVSFKPNLQVQTLEIGNTEVKGTPDIIYFHHRIKEDGEALRLEDHVIAVCEVRTDKPFSAETSVSPPSSKARNKSEEVSSSCTHSKEFQNQGLQISEKLIGQHCGELLCKFGQSIHCNSVFGMVVQQTFVTVTELGMTFNQYLKLKDGRFKHSNEDGPSFTFTKPYNFLKKEDLEKLLGPFIKFGLEQED